MELFADYKSDYVSMMNSVSRSRRPLFVDDDERAAYISVLINLVWITIATALLGTMAGPVGIVMLIVFMFTFVKQIMTEDVKSRFNRSHDA